MKKSIFLFFAAILCSVSAWAFNITASYYVYFEKPSDWSNVSLLLGHNTWSQGYNFTKISNTNLYYWKTIKWDNATEYYFIDATGWGGEGKKPTDRKGYASHASSKFTTNFSKYHLFTSSKEVKKDASSYATAVNRTQTIKVQLKDGSNWVDATVVPADLTASTYALTSEIAAGAKSASLAKESTTVSGTVSAAYSATVSLTCGTPIDGYIFEGWYDANGNKITSYTVSDAHTVYARFIQSAEENNEVTISYKCSTTDVTASITEQVGVESEKSFTAPTVTGYNFTGWTIGTGIDLKAGTASDATITVVTKSASSDYTLVANYEEVIETVYFINTNKWARVNIHKWNGKAAASSWPGEKLTASGEKIGEYDVYSYTAKQGDYAKIIFNSKTSSTDSGNAQTADLDWTADKYYIHNYNGNTGWYTKEEAEALLVVPVVEETIYFVNNKKWTKVQAYAWNNSANNVWPGVALTATGEKVAGYDVYSYTAPQGYVNVIFNNKTGDSGEQSADFVWTNGKYYCMGADANYAGGTQENVETIIAEYALAANVYLAGEMTNPDNWDINKKAFKKATADATTATVTVALTAKTYKFKLVVDGAWKGNGGIMKRGENAVHEGGWSFDEDKDCQIVADIAGDYTFTWNLTDKKLTVAYPPLPKHQVTATVNPAETGEVIGTGEYEQGSEATLVATPAPGYAFKNWTVGGTEKSTEATYTFTVNEPISLVANFIPEVTKEVTISYLCGDAAIPGHAAQTLAVGVTTPSTITASSITNYTFTNWTVGNGLQTEDDAADNPIHITAKAEGEYTLVANYTKIELTYTVKVPEGTEKCFIRGAFDGWDKFHEMELKEGETNIFTLTIDGATTEHKYKYACQASWDYKELNADGTDVADRTWNAMDEVKKWAKPDTYTIAGTPAAAFGTEWDANSVANIMRKQDDGTFVWSAKGLVLTTTEVKFKVVKNQDWNTAWPSSDKVVTIPADGIYNLTIYFNAGEKDDESKNNGIYVNLEAVTPDYTREVDPQYYGTICLPKAGKFVGGSLYEVAHYDVTTKKVYFDEVLNGEMGAGMPYVFLANATKIEAYYTNDEEATAKEKNGLCGTLDDITSGMDADGVYMIYRNQIIHSTHPGSYLNANRAYIKLTEVPGYNDPSYVAPAPAPGRKRIAIGQAPQVATGMENVDASAQPVKTIINGQLYILRGEKMYDAQGKLVK